MVIDFDKLDLRNGERPVLILKNIDGTPIHPIGCATHVKGNINYNETSELTFEVPAVVDGNPVPYYDALQGLRIIELADVGQFILMKPEDVTAGPRRYKNCTAYSLEYEFTYKKITLPENTYNFYNPVAPADTVLGMIMAEMPAWSLGYVDPDLYGKYRTFAENNANIYNFIKNTVQQKYGCIFVFNTMERKVDVRSTAVDGGTCPVYISSENLAKQIKVSEKTDEIVTVLSVSGAENLDIRPVNPIGTNKIYDLDYYMTSEYFSPALITKWNNWKAAYAAAQRPYYNLIIQQMLKTSERLTAQAKLTDMENIELGSLNMQLSTYIEALAINPNDSVAEAGKTTTLAQIAAKEIEVAAQRELVESLDDELAALNVQIRQVNRDTNFYYTDESGQRMFNFGFTEADWVYLDRFFKEDSIEDSSFVVSSVSSYSPEYLLNILPVDATVRFWGGNITHILQTSPDLFTVSGGMCAITANDDVIVEAEVVNASFEIRTDHTFVLSCYIKNGTAGEMEFPSGCLSLTGLCEEIPLDDFVPDDELPEAYEYTDEVTITIADDTQFYLTTNTTEYEKYSVEWDLLAYGQDCLKKLSSPSYTFSVSLANFFSLDEYISFVQSIELGKKIYLRLNEAKMPIEPVFIGAKIDFENKSSLELVFSDNYNSSDPSFSLAQLLETSVSMGHNLDVSRFSYNEFIDSGAASSVRDFITSALDVSKNEIMSSSGQSVSWDKSGLHLRKTLPNGSYDPAQIWMINNSIVFTDDGWDSVKMAIGKFSDSNAGDVWGIVAPNIVGTMLAGENLIIESQKQDGGVSVFRVDGNGAVLHNAKFDIVSDRKHIMLDPTLGFGLGVYPITNPEGTEWNPDNVNFYVNADGSVYMRGRVDAEAGGTIGGFNIEAGALSVGTGQHHIELNGSNPVYAIWAGADDPTLAPFSVTKTGNVRLNDGVIGGFNVDDGSLSSGLGVNHIELNGDNPEYAFWAGADAPEDAPFSVKRDGSIMLNGSGTINASNIAFQGAHGGFKEGVGSNGETLTYGALMYGSDPNKYFFISESGLRLQTAEHAVYLTDNMFAINAPLVCSYTKTFGYSLPTNQVTVGRVYYIIDSSQSQTVGGYMWSKAEPYFCIKKVAE